MEKELEFSKKQIERIDEIDNAVFELLKVLINDENLQWSMELIGDASDLLVDMLVEKGYKIYYPAIVYDENGNGSILDFVTT